MALRLQLLLCFFKYVVSLPRECRSDSVCFIWCSGFGSFVRIWVVFSVAVRGSCFIFQTFSSSLLVRTVFSLRSYAASGMLCFLCCELSYLGSVFFFFFNLKYIITPSSLLSLPLWYPNNSQFKSLFIFKITILLSYQKEVKAEISFENVENITLSC